MAENFGRWSLIIGGEGVVCFERRQLEFLEFCRQTVLFRKGNKDCISILNRSPPKLKIWDIAVYQ